MAFRRTGSASSRLKSFPKPKLNPIAPKPGDATWMSPKGIVLTMLTLCSVLSDCVCFELFGVDRLELCDVVYIYRYHRIRN